MTPFTAFLAWICSLVANFTCDYITIDLTITNETVGTLTYYLGFGFWNYQGWSYLVQEGTIYYARTCYTYSDLVNPDAKWKSAQAFSIIAVVIGGLAMCFNCCVICTPTPAKWYQCFSLLYLFTCLSQALTFLFLSSNACQNNPVYNLESDLVEITGGSAKCSLSWGANTGIAATVLWFVTACMMCCVGFKESKGADSYDEPEDVPIQAEKKEAAADEPAAE